MRFLSVSKTGQVAFEQDFKLQTFDLDQFNADGSAGIRVVKLDCASESKHNEEVRLDIGGSITEMALSPLGSALGADRARGFVYRAAARSEKPGAGWRCAILGGDSGHQYAVEGAICFLASEGRPGCADERSRRESGNLRNQPSQL